MINKLKKRCVAIGLIAALCVSMAGCALLPEDEPAIEVVGTSDGMYAYETLSEEEKQVYNEITFCLEQRMESIEISTLDEAVLEKVYWAVYYDHCEYFWSDGYQYEIYSNWKDEVVEIRFQPIYNVTEEAQAVYQKQIDAAVADILAEAPVEGTDYDKALFVYRTLIENTDYNLDAEHNQNIISTFVNKETVCRGYAYGAQYLLNALEVPCISVCGVSEGEAHSWNLIQMDGEYYYMDVTWGEVEYWEASDEDLVPPEDGDSGIDVDGNALGETQVGQNNDVDNGLTGSETVNYSYFGVSDADTAFMAEHVADSYVPLPACTATENNYYVHEGLYFEEWNRSAVGDKIEEAFEQGEAAVFLKFATTELYDQAFEYLIEDGKWGYYCDLDQIVYVDHFEENVLMLEFPYH